MIDLTATLQGTNAYRIIKSDKENNSLSHAYLILTQDKVMLKEYVKIFACTMCCPTKTKCGVCRTCSLIDSESHPDVIFYPQNKDKDKNKDLVTVEDIASLIEESYIKPIECDKKVFVILNAQNMNTGAQNKLLKTLEEPPKNVHIILGATNEFSLLPTIKSRVKRLEIPTFDNNVIEKAMASECPDKEKLKLAVSCGDGTIGKALSLYGDKQLEVVSDLVQDTLNNMNSSKDVLSFSTKILNAKVELTEFLSVLELLLRDMLVKEQNCSDVVINQVGLDELKSVKGFSTGAIIHALDCIIEANKRKKFNMNETMLLEWLLFQILEGKYKWQKF